jgi:antitoxin HicB
VSAQYLNYSMLIEWSDEDQAYLVTLPEWAESVMQPVTHGATYEEAAKNGREVLELLAGSAKAEGEPLPPPRAFVPTTA